VALNQKERQQYWELRDEIHNMILSRLNDEQEKAVTTGQGPVLCLAGAGSGKTTAMVYRIFHLLAFGPAYDPQAEPPDWLTGQDLDKLALWLSGAGQKDGLLSRNLLALIGQQGIPMYKILAITFTNKAAQEMRDRLEALLGSEVSDMWVMTFHSACLRILKRESDELDGYDRNFTIYDAGDQEQAIKEILRPLNLDEKQHNPKTYLHWISQQKSNMKLAPHNYTPMSKDWEQMAPLVYQRYQAFLQRNNAMDFDDLLLQTVILFKNKPSVLAKYQERFQYIMVDEYQDTNHIQYVFVNLLAKQHQNICVVGDDDQSIYGFRQADIRNILDFERDFPGAQVIRLEQNYRSTSRILEAANQLVANNLERKKKSLWTKNPEGEKIFCFRAERDLDEARFVASRIQQNYGLGEGYGDHAVLLRTNAQSRILEEWFSRYLIPYVIIGGLRFYERKEIKDVLAYLKFLANPDDQIALKRIINVPRRGIGDSTINRLLEYCQETNQTVYTALVNKREIGFSSRADKALSEFLQLIDELLEIKEQESVTGLTEAVLRRTGYWQELQANIESDGQERLENLKEFMNKTLEYDKLHEDGNLADFLGEISLITDMDMVGDDARHQAVQVMTMHMAKGLEFPHVFVMGMEEGVFPHFRSLYNERELEEERRLCYVAMTRAKKRLYLSCAGQRMVHGRTQVNQPSRFLEEIPDYLKEVFPAKSEPTYKDLRNSGETAWTRGNAGSAAFGSAAQAGSAIQSGISANQKADKAKVTFKVGDKVLHQKWGKGVIVSTKEQGGNLTYQIAFPNNQGIRTVLAEYAPLTLL
jgi:DNA helicase-2/ATP-dependent DNA helicase PcrA